MLYSITETARVNGHNPYQYLPVLLTELPAAETQEQIEAQLPWNLTPEQVAEKYQTFSAPQTW